MNASVQILTVGGIVLATHCIEGITGFGCTVLALPFVAMIFGIRTAVPALVALECFLAVCLVMRSRKLIQWPSFLWILVHVVVGLPLGILLFDHLPENGLKMFLAVVMLLVGGRGLWVMSRLAAAKGCATPGDSKKSFLTPKGWLMRGILVLGGVIHGSFGTGGPLVVIYADRALLEKSLFRVTLSLLWLSLNGLLVAKWTWGGHVWDHQIAMILLAGAPFSLAGMLMGSFLHDRVNERLFRMLVYAALILAGGVLFASTLHQTSLDPRPSMAALHADSPSARTENGVHIINQRINHGSANI